MLDNVWVKNKWRKHKERKLQVEAKKINKKHDTTLRRQARTGGTHTDLNLPSSGHSTSAWGDKTWRKRKVDITKKKKIRWINKSWKEQEKDKDRLHAKGFLQWGVLFLDFSLLFRSLSRFPDEGSPFEILTITSGGPVLTLISMFPTLAVERMMGLPTSAGKMCSGKLEPA